MLLDLRTPAEFAAGGLDGSINLDFRAADFASRLAQLDTTRTYLVICRGGVRSGKAMAMMQAAGFAAAYNLDGGLLRWQAEKRPMLVGSPIS